MSIDLGFCGCHWESLLDRGIARPSKSLARVTCREHYAESMENTQHCPDCGGPCYLVSVWEKAS